MGTWTLGPSLNVHCSLTAKLLLFHLSACYCFSKVINFPTTNGIIFDIVLGQKYQGEWKFYEAGMHFACLTMPHVALPARCQKSNKFLLILILSPKPFPWQQQILAHITSEYGKGPANYLLIHQRSCDQSGRPIEHHVGFHDVVSKPSLS